VPVAGIRTAAAAAHAAAVAAHTVAAVGRKAVARTAVAVTRTAVDSGGTAMEASTCLRTPQLTERTEINAKLTGAGYSPWPAGSPPRTIRRSS
jgi:hypothetical protein